ncbi:hypothetical protein PN502_02960, partial [Microcystis aeruginosa CS-338/01]|nr:hypothetical protein [Microcystis aeruginosa CS-338/01]
MTGSLEPKFFSIITNKIEHQSSLILISQERCAEMYYSDEKLDLRFFGLSYAMDGSIRDETLIEKDIWRFLSIVFDPERTNQLNLLPDKNL